MKNARNAFRKNKNHFIFAGTAEVLSKTLEVTLYPERVRYASKYLCML